MSRIGNRELVIPENVTVTVDGNVVSVKGPKGELSTEVNKNITVKVEGNKVICTRANDNYKNFHGTANANIKNMIIGVTDGFEKKLEAVGVGYRFQIKGNTLVITAGFSHPVEIDPPEGITFDVPAPNQIIVRGIDKEVVGQTAAVIRSKRPPEVYRGKGIKYVEEHIRRKEGKAGKK